MWNIQQNPSAFEVHFWEWLHECFFAFERFHFILCTSSATCVNYWNCFTKKRCFSKRDFPTWSYLDEKNNRVNSVQKICIFKQTFENFKVFVTYYLFKWCWCIISACLIWKYKMRTHLPSSSVCMCFLNSLKPYSGNA